MWPPWSSSAARPSPFFGRVVPQPRVFALLPAPRARHIPRYVVGEAPPPRLAGVPHPRRRTVGLKSASAGLRTLEAASPAAKARFSSLPLCGEALPRLSAEGNRREAGRDLSAPTRATARASRQSHERVSRAQRDFDPRRCRARALHACQNHAGGLPAKLGSRELSGRSAVRRATGANQSAGTYGGVYVESR